MWYLVYSKENEREKKKDKILGAICRGTMNCAPIFLEILVIFY